MPSLARVLPGVYQDSIKLMRISSAASAHPGVRQAMAVLGTPVNLEQLQAAGLDPGEARGAGPNDLVLAVLAESEAVAAEILREMEAALTTRPPGGAPGAGQPASFSSLDAALGADPGINLALLSIPGPWVRREAERALRKGLHCLIFSDNVSLEDEVALKRLGRERGLLVMGPDCGTCHIAGVGLGFCNVVRPGPIGIVGAAGTGIQEALAAIDRAGGGIRCALGTGGRDVTDAVAGLAMTDAIRFLAADPAAQALLILGKPPGPGAMKAILGAIGDSGKPAVVHFVGADSSAIQRAYGGKTSLCVAGTLSEAGRLAVSLAKGSAPAPSAQPPQDLLSKVTAWAWRGKGSRRKFLRGLYAGGTLCAEAQAILRKTLGTIHSNAPLAKADKLADPEVSLGHTVIDLGDDRFTRGRPHPMIEPSLRERRMLREAGDPETAVLLFDVVLGLGAHPDPGGEAAKTVAEARRQNPDVLYLCSVTGTAGDPQGLEAQRRKLEAAGAVVAGTHAEACLLAEAAFQEMAG
ncbi:MAG: hypothetical protein HY618_08765 [Candidatus Tectomicrobia bacterium]|uniref:Cytochrome c domain-containing protein n=1 Tax=Tectimicrobiota bacterium TaxID=2528274 RepID=A0A932ZUV3_UNCTE|nr:hypothetical protein [Candidatus Tectomicrobia bacterium]